MLNLLPPEIKDQRRIKSLLYSTFVTYIVVAVAIGLGLAGLVTWGLVQQSEITNRQGDIQQLASQRRAKEALISKASFIEDRLKAASSFQEKRQWELILDEIATATPTNTILTGIRVAKTETDQIDLSISGTTTDRRSIVLFRDKLEASETVSKATILSLSETTVNDRKEFRFSLSASYTATKEKAGG